LLEAVKKLLDAGYDVSVKLAGSGQTYEEIRSLTKELRISEQFEFSGYVRDIPAFLAGLDAFILPSIAYEGLSLALLEAMALQIPVIATPIAGTSEVVVNGYNGLLVPPADSELLAKAIENLIQNPALAEKLGMQGRVSIMDKYTYDILVDKVADIYRTICEMG
jgi:glycosyltransferase involved in cell wall biosynthesis